MALKINNGTFTNNQIGMDNGGLQPTNDGNYGLGKMRLNNGAPTRNGSNDDVIDYNNNNSSEASDDKNFYQDRVISTTNDETTTYVTARDANYFALHNTPITTDLDNNTDIGNVTETGKFHYVGPQTKVSTDSANYVWDDKGTTEDTSDDTNANSRISEINKIYMVGSVNAMSAR